MDILGVSAPRQFFVATHYLASEMTRHLITRDIGQTVLMTDERLVDFPPRRKMLSSPYVDADGVVCIRLDFRNGATRTLKLRDDMLLKFAAEGAERTLRTAIAKVGDIDEVVRAIDKRIARFDSGEWTSGR